MHPIADTERFFLHTGTGQAIDAAAFRQLHGGYIPPQHGDPARIAPWLEITERTMPPVPHVIVEHHLAVSRIVVGGRRLDEYTRQGRERCARAWWRDNRDIPRAHEIDRVVGWVVRQTVADGVTLWRDRARTDCGYDLAFYPADMRGEARATLNALYEARLANDGQVDQLWACGHRSGDTLASYRGPVQ